MHSCLKGRVRIQSSNPNFLTQLAMLKQTIRKYIIGLETQKTSKTNGAGRKGNTDQHKNRTSTLTRTKIKRLDETNVGNKDSLPQGRDSLNADQEAVTQQTGRKTAGVRQLGKHSTKVDLGFG
jgi:hypothetical protein